METRPPTITRILVAIGFALSCFALALFLWISFGGPLPLKAEGYRFTVPFREATQLAVQSDVRISGVTVGQVKSIDLDDNGFADATIQLDSRYAPIPADTKAILRQKTLLGETFVELTPGDENGPDLAEGGTLPRAQVADSVQLDEIFRAFNGRTRQAFKTWMQGAAAATRGRGPDISAAIAELDPFAEQANRLLRVLDSQRLAVRQLFRSGGDVFQALSERKGQLRGLIQNSAAVFDTTARRNEALADTFRILPTFQRESRATLERLDRFGRTADPLVQQLRPAARELSPSLVAAGRAAPDLERFFKGLRRPIRAAKPGFPALRRLLRDDLTPLLSRLGGTVDGVDPYLAHLNPIVESLGKYKHEITAFVANATAATNYGAFAAEANGRYVRMLRTTSPLNPESLATFSHRLKSNRANPYFKPLGYSRIMRGLETFANTPCSAGITATLPPASQVTSDPNFQARTTPAFPDVNDLYTRIKAIPMGGVSSVDNVPAPPCDKQGKLSSIGGVSERTFYRHVYRDR
jgi:phospholipid/cholesterol/gamma-HCH transport system substrate-binding protein